MQLVHQIYKSRVRFSISFLFGSATGSLVQPLSPCVLLFASLVDLVLSAAIIRSSLHNEEFMLYRSSKKLRVSTKTWSTINHESHRGYASPISNSFQGTHISGTVYATDHSRDMCLMNHNKPESSLHWEKNHPSQLANEFFLMKQHR